MQIVKNTTILFDPDLGATDKGSCAQKKQASI